MAINWNNIRPINNSRNDGFEELVCQLAGKEKISNQRKFWRVGKPDGGKECFWQLENGDIYAWQAKYFTTSLSTTQWTQIEKSVKSVIDNHASLKKYFISIPLDMPDAKIKGKKSMLDKWHEKEKDWKEYAQSKGMTIEFEFWGNHQLVNKLAIKENEGLKYFWFNEEEFTDEWIDTKNRESINALGARYTPELNFELPIAEMFDGLARDVEFEKQIHNYYKKLLEKYRGLRIHIENEEIKSLAQQLKDFVDLFKTFYNTLCFGGNTKLPIDKLNDFSDSLLETTGQIYHILQDLREEQEKTKKVDYYNRPFGNEFHNLSNFESAVNDFLGFINSTTCKLVNTPYLLLGGEAGMGKSHLLGDIIEKRRLNNQLSLFLLGENFSNRDMPWTQILNNQLRKTYIDEFIFLGALNAKAESSQTRIVIFIDALNEGEGKVVWPKKLKSFIQTFEKYPWLGLVVSIRSSFLPLIAPMDEVGDQIAVRENHEGFLGMEYQASKQFFHHYKIVQPGSPLLHPEFQNPLFLKLFCLSLHTKGIHEVPVGYEGITTVINSFLESIDIKLARPENLYYEEKKWLVRKAVEAVLSKMVEAENDYLIYEEADKIIDSIFKENCSNPEPFLRRLISEGVFNTDLHWDAKGNYTDVIRFSYQRFQDHLTVSMMLDMCLNKEDPEKSFGKGKLYELLKDERSARFNQNYIEALSIQVPERIGKELYQVAPHSKLFYSVAEGFVNSLLWRRSDTLNDGTKEYVNNVVCANERLFYRFLDVAISTSTKPSFYFNAERLHIALSKFNLSQRDKWWTIWLQNKYGEQSGYNSVKRLIDWAWNDEDKTYVSDESIRLGCITLAWFLASSNRYLRDAATKALVCLLQDRKHLLIPILELFKDVNDPYILERLYAVTYGCTLRSQDTNNLVELSEYIYKIIFSNPVVYSHILLRDYARGVIEFTLNKNLHPKLDIKKVRPPYKSKRLPNKFPTNVALDKKYKPKGKSGHYGKESWGATSILSSMTTEYGRGTSGYGDFGRYTFQRAFSNWEIDYDGLSNYAVKRIFELGYDAKLFSEFDSQQNSGRGSGHKERIGKKYQWIVFHELLAQVSDQYPLYDEHGRWDKITTNYEGPWHPNVRDIDPSIIIKEIKEKYYKNEAAHWWFNQPYANWDKSHKEWVRDKKDLPAPASIIEAKDENGSSWLWLEIHPDWDEPEKLGEDKWSEKRKCLWYQIRSYIIKKEDKDKFEKDFKRDFYRGELPEARRLSNVYSREYYQSPIFQYYSAGEDWEDVHNKKTGIFIGKVLRTTEEFAWEKEFDCSKEGSVTFYKPCNALRQALGIGFCSKEGELLDRNGSLICFDPAVNNKSISGLLIKKEALCNFLEREGLILMWSVIGEKQILGGSWRKSDYPGRMNISGLYFLEDGAIKGNLKTQME